MDFETAEKLWRYDPSTGLIHWRSGARKPVGPTPSGGYLTLNHEGRGYKAHRLAWLLTFGRWPEHEIDHINGVRNDNRLANLRDVPHRINQLNQSHHRGIPRHKSEPLSDIRIAEIVTKARCLVTCGSDMPRARTPSFGGDVTLSPVTFPGDSLGRDSDSPGLKPVRHHHAGQAGA